MMYYMYNNVLICGTHARYYAVDSFERPDVLIKSIKNRKEKGNNVIEIDGRYRVNRLPLSAAWVISSCASLYQRINLRY